MTNASSEEETRNKTRNKTRDKILSLIKANDTITTSELASELGISEKGIEYQLTNLKKDKKIVRIGSKKGGRWEIIE